MENRRSRYRFLWNLLFFILFLYLFLVSIELIGKAFKGFGGGFAEELIATISNPFVGLFIGVLATTIAQSSSLTTSVLVGMVAAGTITVPNAIPVAFAHLCFNICGTAIWYPLKKLPIKMSLKMAEICTESRKLALAYLIVVFYIVPGLLILIMR